MVRYLYEIRGISYGDVYRLVREVGRFRLRVGIVRTLVFVISLLSICVLVRCLRENRGISFGDVYCFACEVCRFRLRVDMSELFVFVK